MSGLLAVKQRSAAWRSNPWRPVSVLDSPGLRPLDKKHLAVLEQSMRDYGYREEFPILIDQYGRILNGRHRIAAAHRAGVVMPEPTTVQVSSDEEAVGFAILANFERGWTEAERNRINADLEGSRPDAG